MQAKITVRPEFTLELAGDICISDPCYWFSDKKYPGLWGTFCDLMFPEGKNGTATDGGIATITMSNGFEFEFIYASTVYGDGSYQVQGSGSFRDFGVDAGMFSAVRCSALAKFNHEFNPATEGVVITDFDGTIEVSETREGWMEGTGRNSFRVETDSSDEEEDYDSFWGEDEEEEEE
jgi:hypothetical protein